MTTDHTHLLHDVLPLLKELRGHRGFHNQDNSDVQDVINRLKTAIESVPDDIQRTLELSEILCYQNTEPVGTLMEGTALLAGMMKLRD